MHPQLEFRHHYRIRLSAVCHSAAPVSIAAQDGKSETHYSKAF